MKFSTAFFALVPLVAALPPALRSVEGTNGTRDHRSMLGTPRANIFVCTDAGFTGNCGVFTGTSGECINFPSSFNDDITAVGPDDGQDCFFYMQQLGPIRSPGIANLNVAATVAFNDHISSFKCFFG
ncbi:hypothetical protein B0H13DRAFT_1906114 [Mycena leptocephala]|nr:hypothetical protein B0H13DRAFT_1906114 [Mycena leptocephala]